MSQTTKQRSLMLSDGGELEVCKELKSKHLEMQEKIQSVTSQFQRAQQALHVNAQQEIESIKRQFNLLVYNTMGDLFLKHGIPLSDLREGSWILHYWWADIHNVAFLTEYSVQEDDGIPQPTDGKVH